MKYFLSLILLGVCVTSCGSGNVFETLASTSKDDKDKGRSALTSGDYDKAIDYLGEYVKNNPNDTHARSMLATAYLKKTGVDELQIAASIMSAQEQLQNTGGSANADWKAMLEVLPAGTDANIENLQGAVDALKMIPEASRTKEQNYQLAVASTALAVSVVKQVTNDGSGNYEVTPETAAQVTDEKAAIVLESVVLASSAVAASGMGDTGDSISGLQTQIDEMTCGEGATECSDADKLRQFLIQKSG